MKIKRYNELMQEMIASMIAQQDKITDFNPGSVIHTLLDTIARIGEQQYIAIRQGYNEILKLIPFSLFEFEMKKGTRASGSVKFLRDNALPTATVIPIGTIVSSSGLLYRTINPGTIPADGTISSEIPIRAEGAGAAYNLEPYSIDTIESVLPSDVVLVEQPEPIAGGKDQETEQEATERFKTYINGLSGTTSHSLLNSALEIEGVRSVSIRTHRPPLHDVYNLTVYVDDGSGGAGQDIIDSVRLAIEGDGSPQNQGHLAPGINARILPPQIVPIHYDLTVYVYRANPDTIENEVKKVLQEYTNSLTISENVVMAEAIKRIMGIPQIRDCKGNTENIILSSDQIPRYGSLNLTITEQDV